ncbi:helix-turn-helix domain-containing protein [Streptomyces sp. NPDC059455]|uniref:helix-turn-helix domain-containing protein n=1 Tax=Streptomyces sp. NPDC059455 TaxID=3346837 RepID=UPI00369E5F48
MSGEGQDGESVSQTLDARINATKAAVARRLRHLRQHHPEGPFSLAALAERASVAKRTLAQAESAEGSNLTIETLVKVAHSLGITREGYFLDEKVFREVNAELAALAELKRQRVEGVALRTASPPELTTGSVKELSELLTGILASAEKARDALQVLPPEADIPSIDPHS